MALDNSRILVAAKGYVFIAPEGTVSPLPEELADFRGGNASGEWENIGHTSRDELPEFGYEGGDTETLGTWQSSVVREVVTEAPADYVTFNLQQFDQSALELYYGVASGGSTQGVFEVMDASTSATVRSLLIVIEDGLNQIAFHSGHASIRREDAMTHAVDELSTLPLRATFLKSGTDALFSWISPDFPVNELAS